MRTTLRRVCDTYVTNKWFFLGNVRKIIKGFISIVLQWFNWLMSLTECSSDLGSSFPCLRGFIFSESLEFNFDISLNIISSFLPFSSALDVSDDEAIIIDDLVEFSLLLIDLIFRVFALFAFYSSWTTLQQEFKFSHYHFYLFFEGSSWVVVNVNVFWPFTNFAFPCISSQCCFKLWSNISFEQ